MKALNRSLVTLYARQEFLDWLKSVKPTYASWTLERLNYRPTAYLAEQEDQNCETDAFLLRWLEVLEHELGEMFYIERDLWPPEPTIDLFRRWFRIQYHEWVCDLSPQPLVATEE